MNNEISKIGLIETSKADRKEFVSNLVAKVINEELDGLEVHTKLKNLEGIIKAVNESKEYKEAILDAAYKHGEKGFELHNAAFRTGEVGVKYDFSKCGDPALVALIAQLEEIKEAVKKQETFLKTVPSEGLELLDKETGEAYTVYPPSKSSTTALIVTLK